MIDGKGNRNGETKSRWIMPVKDGISLGEVPGARDAQTAMPRSQKPLIPEPRHRYDRSWTHFKVFPRI